MPAQLLYQTESYIKSFEATITAASDAGVQLNRTAFYPGGGGQPADFGTIQSENGETFSVNGAKRQGQDWLYTIDGDKLPEVGEAVRCNIDWQRRYALMRTHTAMHILCGVVFRDFGALVTGGNMTPGQGRLDFEFEQLQRDMVEDIEAKINQEVQAARPIEIQILPREAAFKIPDLIRTKINLLPQHIQEIRTVHIVGLDLQADGGTHVANTEEVGPLRILQYKSKGRLNKRLVVGLT